MTKTAQGMGERNWEYTIIGYLNYWTLRKSHLKEFDKTVWKILKVTSRDYTCPGVVLNSQKKFKISYFLSNLAIKPSAHEECWHLVGFPLSFHSFSPSFLGWDNNFVEAKHGGLLIMKITHWQLYCTFLQRHFLGSVLMSKRDIWGEPLVLGIIQIYKVTASITAFQLCGEMAQGVIS